MFDGVKEVCLNQYRASFSRLYCFIIIFCLVFFWLSNHFWHFYGPRWLFVQLRVEFNCSLADFALHKCHLNLTFSATDFNCRQTELPFRFTFPSIAYPRICSIAKLCKFHGYQKKTTITTTTGRWNSSGKSPAIESIEAPFNVYLPKSL